MTTQLFQSGGVQTTVNLPQIIYLDFDGELTSYNGEILTVDNVTVEDSGLTAERIAAITAMLNQQFRDQNVEFVTEKPASGDYSTIYVGKTSSFTPYGSFAGLAETVDSGNKIRNDNAFVILDSTSDNAQIISTIAHEAGHLLGTLDHGGEGLEKYADYNYKVGSGELSSGVVLENETMGVLSGGTVLDTTIGSGGALYIEGGGAADNIHTRTGAVHIKSGGTAINLDLSNCRNKSITLASDTLVKGIYGSSVFSMEDGYCSGFYVANGMLSICSGCSADALIVDCGGSLNIDNGAAVNSSFIGISGFVNVNGSLGYTTLSNSISQWTSCRPVVYVFSGGTVTDTTFDCCVEGDVYDGGIVDSSLIGSLCWIYVHSGGILQNITLAPIRTDPLFLFPQAGMREILNLLRAIPIWILPPEEAVRK